MQKRNQSRLNLSISLVPFYTCVPAVFELFITHSDYEFPSNSNKYDISQKLFWLCFQVHEKNLEITEKPKHLQMLILTAHPLVVRALRQKRNVLK